MPARRGDIANAALLTSQRLDDGRPRPPLETPDESAEMIEQLGDASIGVGEVRDANDAALAAHERCDVRAISTAVPRRC